MLRSLIKLISGCSLSLCELLTQWQDEEERKPAKDKHTNNDPKRLGRLLLPLELGNLSGERDANMGTSSMALMLLLLLLLLLLMMIVSVFSKAHNSG